MGGGSAVRVYFRDTAWPLCTRLCRLLHGYSLTRSLTGPQSTTREKGLVDLQKKRFYCFHRRDDCPIDFYGWKRRPWQRSVGQSNGLLFRKHRRLNGLIDQSESSILQNCIHIYSILLPPFLVISVDGPDFRVIIIKYVIEPMKCPPCSLGKKVGFHLITIDHKP